MASVSELIQAAEFEKSPLIRLLEGAAGGVNQAQNSYFDNAVRIQQAQKLQQEIQMAKAAEERKAAQRAATAQSNAVVQENFRAAGGKGAAVMPGQKMTKIVDEEGNVTTSTTYGSDNADLNSLLYSEVESGRMTLPEAYAMKNRSGGGLSNELAYRMGQDQLKAAKEEKAKEIPGYKRTGTVEVDDIETRKLREGVPEFETFKTAVTDYKSLIEKFGTQQFTDRRVQGQMSALAKNLQLKVKNLAQLGVLSASDIPFIEEQIPTPGLFKTKEGMLGALETAEKLMQTAIDNKMKVGGYQATSVAPPGVATVPAGKITVSNGKETLHIDPSDEADAAKDGFRRMP